jgi:ComF family protein
MPATMAHGWRDRMVGMVQCALPQACALCAARTGNALICGVCADALPHVTLSCPRCALPSDLDSAQPGQLCGQCITNPPAFERSEAAFIYAFPLDCLVQAFKYHGALAYADWFALAMLERRPAPPVADVLIPLPLARSRQRERGFNQALEIARPLARWVGIPLLAGAAVRVRDTPPQVSLPWSERAKNIRSAFACAADLTGRKVIVIDDVMTTGASLEEFAKTLKRAGATSVENWLIARTPRPSDF